MGLCNALIHRDFTPRVVLNSYVYNLWIVERYVKNHEESHDLWGE